MAILRSRRPLWRSLAVAVAASIGVYYMVYLAYVVTSVDYQLSSSKLDDGSAMSIHASYLRIVPQVGGPENMVDLVLSVDMKELKDVIESYQDAVGDIPAKVRYPYDVNITLENAALCGGNGMKNVTSPSTTPEPLSLKWVVFVHSSPANVERRRLLRETWANVRLFRTPTFRVVFFMGIPVADTPSGVEKLQRAVDDEFVAHGDIVQGNFIDDYRNLTLKAVLALRWVATRCGHVPYAVKADDDTFLDVFELARLMTKHANEPSTIICPLWKDNTMPILRDPAKCMKWCVKRSEFRGRTHFPRYCAGIGYAVAAPLVSRMHRAAATTPFFWIDDVYVTGLLSLAADQDGSKDGPTQFVDLLANFTMKEDLAVEQYTNRSEPITIRFVHVKNADNFRKLWRTLLLRQTPEQLRDVSDDVVTVTSLPLSIPRVTSTTVMPTKT